MLGNMYLQAVFILCFAAVVLGAHDFEVHARETYDHKREKCLAETSVDTALIDKANDGIFTEDKNLKCYMRCLFDSFDMFKDDGYLEFDKMLTIIPEEHQADYVPMIKACLHIGGLGDICQVAFDLHKCYHNENSHLHFLL